MFISSAEASNNDMQYAMRTTKTRTNVPNGIGVQLIARNGRAGETEYIFWNDGHWKINFVVAYVEISNNTRTYWCALAVKNKP